MRLQDVLRRLWRSPMFTAITVVTLALGIGANSAIFSVLEGILLKPLPYPQPENLIDLNHSAPGVNLPSAGSAPFLYFTYREENRTFQNLGLWQGDMVSVTGLAEPEQVASVDVTDGVLPLLGIQPILGHWFSPKDDSPGSPETVILTYGYWQARFAGDAGVIGKRIVIDGRAREVIGAMPANFQFLDQKPVLIFPMRLDREKTFLGQFSYQGLARLKPAVTQAEANADVARMIPIALHKFPPFPGYNVKMFEDARLGPNLRPLKQTIIGDLGNTLWILMATLGIVLLIACANVANLLLVRAEGRQHELAIRVALGASWTHLAREMLLESVMLGILGGVLGLGLANGALRILIAIAPAGLPRLGDIAIDAPVLLFTFLVSIAAGVLFGSIPVLKYARPRAMASLRAGGRTLSQSRERHRARSLLVIVQVALALVLLISSGLMIRTFQAMRRIQPGFRAPSEVQTLWISIPTAQVSDATEVVRMEHNIMDKIAAIPGVASAGLATSIPMDGSGWRDPIFAQDKVYSEGQIPPLRRFKFISPGLLATMGNSLIAGREFTWMDTYDRRPVTMVSENLARELWHDPSTAIGKRIRESLQGPWREVVGVVSDEREDGINQEAPTIVFWPLLSNDLEGDAISVRRTVAYIVRSKRAGSASFLKEVQQAVWSVNPDLPLANVRTLQAIYDKSLARTSFTLVMLAIAGGMALLIGIVGVYGVISYSVSQRTREIGIRMALGARPATLTRAFVGHGLMLAASGVVCGMAAAFALMRLMTSLLFEVSPADPVTYAVVSTGLVAATALASYIPALRATTIDPVSALRAE